MHLIHKLIFEDCKYVKETPQGSRVREHRISKLKYAKNWLENHTSINTPKKWVKVRKWLHDRNAGLRVAVPNIFNSHIMESKLEVFEYALQLNDNMAEETKRLVIKAQQVRRLEVFGDLGHD